MLGDGQLRSFTDDGDLYEPPFTYGERLTGL
jgi:hypothetical protein